MSYLIMKSIARGVAETIGCQHSTGRFSGRGTNVNLLEFIAAVRHARRQGVVLAVMGEAVTVKGLEQDLHLLLEQLAVGRLVLQRAAESLDLARVVAATDTEHGAPLCQDVRNRIVLCEAKWMPHWRDVEAATDLQLLGHVGKVHRKHQNVGQDLIPFALEVMLGQPQRVPAEFVHLPRDRLGLLKDGSELIVGEPALISGRGILAKVRHVNVAGIDGHEFADHVALLSDQAPRG